MSLSKLSSPLPLAQRVIIYRFASHVSATPAPARIQLQKPAGEQGFFSYSRNWSRDPRFAKSAIQQGDTPYTFLTRRLGHAYEVYPLIVLTGLWFVLFCGAVYWSFGKIEVWLDRSNKTAPWDWERVKNNYWKQPTIIADLDGRTRQRLEIMEVLQDQMVEAAKKRGTR